MENLGNITSLIFYVWFYVYFHFLLHKLDYCQSLSKSPCLVVHNFTWCF